MNDAAANRWYDAQVAVLGSCLLDEKWVPQVLARSKEADFTETYRPIYRAIRDLHTSGTPVDPVTVKGKTGERYASLIHEMMDLTPTAANCGVYLDLLGEMSRMRRYQELAREMQDAVTPEACQTLAAEIAAVGTEQIKVVGRSAKELTQEFFTRQTTKAEHITMGLDWLDRNMLLSKGHFSIIAGRPSHGKTALAIQCAVAQAKRYKVGFFSLETSDAEVWERVMALTAGISFDHINHRTMSEDEFDQAAQYSAHVSGLRLDIIECSGWTVSQITAYAEKLAYDVIYVDYIQLIRPDGKTSSRFDTVTDISMSLHTFALSHKTAVIGLAQLSRASESRPGKRPQLSDLRESGQIEQDANAVLFIWRTADGGDDHRKLTIAKNKTGRTGETNLAFDGDHQQFTVDRMANERELWEARKKALDKEKKQKRAANPEFEELDDQVEIPF